LGYESISGDVDSQIKRKAVAIEDVFHCIEYMGTDGGGQFGCIFSKALSSGRVKTDGLMSKIHYTNYLILRLCIGF
jgi:hypothetical protein